MLPIVPHGWRAEDAGLLMEIYRGTRGSFPTQSGKSLYGRGGFIACRIRARSADIKCFYRVKACFC